MSSLADLIWMILLPTKVIFLIQSGATLRIGGPGKTQDFQQSSSITGDGTVEFESGMNVINGSYNVTGNTVISGGSSTEFDNDSTTTNFTLSGGNLGGSARFTITGNGTWSGGSMIDQGTTAISGTGVMAITGSGNRTLDQRTLTNNGQVDLNLAASGELRLDNGANIVNELGATFNVIADNTIRRFSGSGQVFFNLGTLTSSATTAALDLDFRNEIFGTVSVSAGTLSFALDTNYSNESHGTIEIASGATFAVISGQALAFTISQSGQVTGSGTIDVTDVDVSLISHGSFRPGDQVGILTVAWDLQLSTGSTVEIDLAGNTTPGTDFDVLNVTGTATLNETLAARLANGFVPAVSNMFQILTCGVACNGNFSTLNPPIGVTLSENTTPSDVTLTVNTVGNIVSWINQSSGNWSTAANWSGGVVPGSSDFVYINQPGDLTISITSTVPQINGLECSETIALSGGTFDIISNSVTDKLRVSGGNLSGSAELNVVSSFVWNNTSTISLNGKLITLPTCTSTLTNANDHALSGVWENFGVVRYNATVGSTDFSVSGSLINRSVGTFEVNGVNGCDWFSSGTVTNEGLFVRNGSGTVSVSPTFNNTGIVRGLSGTISLNGGGTHTGTFESSGGTLGFGGGTHNLNSGNVTGSSTIQFSGGTSNIDSSVTFDLATLSGLTRVNGGTVNFDTMGMTEDLTISFGNLSGTGELTTNGTFSWIGTSTVSINGKLITASGSTTSIVDANDHVLTGTWENFGDVTYSATVNSTDFNITGTLQNRSGGTFTLSSVGGADWFNGGTVLNEGLFVRDGSGTVFISNPFNNVGTLRVLSGAVSLHTGGTHTGSFEALGGTLQFSGGTHSATSGSFNGSSTVQISGGTTTIGSGVTYDLDTLGGLTRVIGGTVNFDMVGSTRDLAVSSGNLSGVGELTVANAFDWTSTSTVSISGKLITASGSTDVDDRCL